MSSEQDISVAALMRASHAPGAAAKLKELGITPAAAEQLIRHLSRIPAYQRNLVSQMDHGPVPDVAPLTAERMVFLHIPKCGGTTLHNMLVDWYGAENLHPERHNGLYYYSARHLASKTLFSGHYDYYGTQLVPGNPKVITFLREPRSRLVSLYNFHRSHRDEVIEKYNLSLPRWANMYDIDEYFAHPNVRAHHAVNNSMARHLSNQPQLGRAANVTANEIPIEVLRDQAIANLADLDFIGIMEHYSASLAQLTTLFGQPLPEEIGRERDFETLIETDINMKKVEKQQATEETHALMDELVVEDEAVYAFALEIFAASLEA